MQSFAVTFFNLSSSQNVCAIFCGLSGMEVDEREKRERERVKGVLNEVASFVVDGEKICYVEGRSFNDELNREGVSSFLNITYFDFVIF